MIKIAELLKDAPKGIKLYSPLIGEVEFAEVMDTDFVPIRVMKRGYGFRFDEYGRYGNEYPDSECLLFPSKDCRTWEGWKLPVEPKFKVGDDIKTGNKIETIAEVDHVTRSYCCESGRTIWFENQDLWQLAPKPHYDISNFKPFDKVLVRDEKSEKWVATFYSHYRSGENYHPYNFVTIGTDDVWIQCIPFEGNEHLLGTTDMCDECYINW